ncbi:MAG: GWxTD domain-containing protein [Bacteroidota bacterium]
MVRRDFVVAAAALLFSSPVCAQEMTPDKEAESSPEFIVQALTYASSDSTKSRIDLFVQVGFEYLSFVKEGDTYGASYDLTATLYDSLNNVSSEQTWTEHLRGLTFNQTVMGGAAKISQRSFTVTPGKYSLGVQVRDNDTKNARQLKQTFLVPSYNRPGLSLSSIMLLSRMVDTGGVKKIVPSVSENMGIIPDAFYIFCQGYDRGIQDSVRLTASVIDKKNEEIWKTDTVQYFEPGRNDIFLRINSSTLSVGDYKLALVARSKDSSAFFTEVARPFVIRWRGMPMSVNSLDLAIDQLRYIARDSEFDSLKAAKTTEEKQQLFLAFWKRRDPNPNTPRNERMEAYYARVDYADKHFSRYRAGWKTDMGMVYIILGPPSNIDRHPFDMDSKPYEVWSYYDINQSYVFVDETGFGDYRLVTPISDLYRYSR